MRFFSRQLVFLQLAIILGQRIVDFSSELLRSLYNLCCRSHVFPSFEIKNEDFVSDDGDRTFKRRIDLPLSAVSRYRLILLHDYFSLTEVRLLARVFGLCLADERCITNISEAVPDEILDESMGIALLGVDVATKEAGLYVTFPLIRIKESIKESGDIFFVQKLEFEDESNGVDPKTCVVFHDEGFERFLSVRRQVQRIFEKFNSFIPKII